MTLAWHVASGLRGEQRPVTCWSTPGLAYAEVIAALSRISAEQPAGSAACEAAGRIARALTVASVASGYQAAIHLGGGRVATLRVTLVDGDHSGCL